MDMRARLIAAVVSAPDCCRCINDANRYIGFRDRNYQRRRRRQDEGLHDALPTGARLRRARRHFRDMRFGLHDGARISAERPNLRHP